MNYPVSNRERAVEYSDWKFDNLDEFEPVAVVQPEVTEDEHEIY